MTVKVTTNYEPDPTDREWECPCIVRHKDNKGLIILALTTSKISEKCFRGLILEEDKQPICHADFSESGFLKEQFKPYDRKVTLQNES